MGTVSIPISQVKKLRLREIYLPTITQEEGTAPHTGISTLDVLKGQYCGQPVDSSAFFLWNPQENACLCPWCLLAGT